MQFLQGVVLSEILVLWVEFFYKFGVNFTPQPFFIAIPLYLIYLCVLHLGFSKLKKSRGFWLTGVAIGGVTGLLLEWFLVGNSPWNKPAVFQAGQFLYHGAYPILGYLLVNVIIPKQIWNRLVVYMLTATGMTSIGFLLSNPDLRKLWLLFLPLLAFVGLYYFIVRLGTLQPQSSKTETMARLH